MEKIKIFLASSSELKADRELFEIFIHRKNKSWVDKGVFLELIIWEDFLDAASQTRMQDEYNKSIKGCDLFVMLFCTKVGNYTEEEFETAFGQFQKTNRPYVFTYFKDKEIKVSEITEDIFSLLQFKKKLGKLGHFYTVYESVYELLLKFWQQLDKLVDNKFIEFDSQKAEKENEKLNIVNITGNRKIVLQGIKGSKVSIKRDYAQMVPIEQKERLKELRQILEGTE